MAWRRVWGYIAMQVLAGSVGAVFTDAMAVRGRHIYVHPAPDFAWLDAGICEVVYSAVFCFVALNCMASMQSSSQGERNQYFALAVGFVGITAGYSTHDISGAFLNPAVTLGYTFFGGPHGFLSNFHEQAWGAFYVGAQVTGAVAATLLFFMVRPEELHALGVHGRGLGFRRALSVVCPGCCGLDGREGDKQDQCLEEAVPPLAASEHDVATAPWPARLLSEFIGTYVIVLTYGLTSICVYLENGGVPVGATNSTRVAVLGNSTQVASAGNLTGHATQAHDTASGHHSASTVAWAVGAAVLSMVYALASASGGHFNPSVTLAVVLSGRGCCSMAEGLTIMVVQAGAAITAALTYVCVHRGRTKHLRLQDLGPHSDYGWSSVAIGETAFTLAVALVYLCMLTVKSARYGKAPSVQSFQFALAIGLCVTAGGFALESISGGPINPAIALGHEAGNFMSSGFVLSDRLRITASYALWESLGGLLAAVVFAVLHPLEYKKDPLLAA